MTWEEIADGGGTEYHHEVIEAEDNPKAILIALRDSGLSYQLAKPFDAHVSEIGKMMTSQELLKSIGYDGDSFSLYEFLKTLKLP